jgi:hypothetical protein
VSPTGVEGTGRGLKAEYFDGQDLTNLRVTRIDPMIDFNWDLARPILGVPTDHFSRDGQVRFSRAFPTLYVLQAPTTAFASADGNFVINDFTDHRALTQDSGNDRSSLRAKNTTSSSNSTTMGGTPSRSSWSSDCQPFEVVPAHQL